MIDRKNDGSDWRAFEQLVGRIEQDAGPLGLKVASPDRLRCRITGRLREVDASIRTRVGTSEVLLTIECRQRNRKQDVTWIEQLATKKSAIGADRTIAVSAAGFSQEAEVAARTLGIDLRKLAEVSAADINNLMRLDFVLFWHKRCLVERVGIRLFQSREWAMPNPSDIDFVLPAETDLFAPIFRNIEEGHRWSINDLWHQLQNATEPFDGVVKGEPPAVRTCCFPYPGNVSVELSTGSNTLGDVLLTVALWLEAEMVTLDQARKVEYVAKDKAAIQRVEFASRDSERKGLAHFASNSKGLR